jgi:4-carboxymuconolactone decarboxylase
VAREKHRSLGLNIRAQLNISEDNNLPSGFRDLVTDTAYAGVWARPGLALPDRMICTLTALTILQRLPHLCRYIGAALDIDIPPRRISEIIIQCGLYCGYPAAETALATMQEVFDDRKIKLDDEIREDLSIEELETAGHAFMAELHGDQATSGYADPNNAYTGGLYRLAVQFGYGVIWQRSGLNVRERMLCSLASFALLGLDETFQKFAASALDIGLESSEVVEAVIQTAPYAGFPRALKMLTILGDTYG